MNKSVPHTQNGTLDLQRVRNWNDLRFFVEIIRRRSLSRAAKSLRVQQPTMTRSLLRLEECLGVRLVERSSQGVKPTTKGRQLYTHVDDFVDAMGRGLRGVSPPEVARTDIKLRMTEGLATYWIARVIPELATILPNVRIKLLTTSHSQEPVMSIFDFEVSFAFPEELALSVKRLGMLHFAPMASSRYLEKHGHPESFDDLRSHHLVENSIITAQHGSWGQLTLMPELDENVVVVVNSMNAYGELVAAGTGIGILPTYFQSLRPDLQRLDLPLLLTWPFHLIRPMDRRSDPILDKFQAWLESHFDRRNHPYFAAFAE